MLNIGQPFQPLGAHVPDFSDPLGLLVHCHVRIEAHLDALERAVVQLVTGDEHELAAASLAIASARSHFAGPGVKHTADEEESLFPRLKRFSTDSDGAIRSAIQELDAQHRMAEAVHAEFDRLVDAAGPALAHAGLDVAEFELTVAELAGLYRPHIRMENEIVFPEAGRIIPPDEILAIGSEMRARRGMNPVGIVPSKA